MKACWCSLAGTAACRSCSNNPYADFPPTVRTNTVTVTDRTFYTQGDRISDFEKLINASDLIEWIMETYPDWCVGAVRSIVDHVEQMPSAQPEQRWIPCNKRLPKGRELVNVSCHDDSGDTSYDYSSCGWVTDDGEYWIVDNDINSFVVAWMPLPEPYKGEE